VLLFWVILQRVMGGRCIAYTYVNAHNSVERLQATVVAEQQAKWRSRIGKCVVQTALMNVRFEGNNGHDADGSLCPLMTQSRHSASHAIATKTRSRLKSLA
jgi:hypothetical protein